MKGVGPIRGELLRTELGIHRIGDLLWDLPFRYIDKSQVSTIRDARYNNEQVQLKGLFTDLRTEGSGHKKRLIASFEDDTGEIEVLWFQRTKEIQQWIKIGKPYLLFGKLQDYKGNSTWSIPRWKMWIRKKPFIPVLNRCIVVERN
jgi:ATP-dependent DNA helicase RecG